MIKNINKIKPAKLTEGSKIGLIAPSGKINIEKFDNVLKNIEKLKLKPVFTNRVFAKEGYLAGNDFNRLDDLHEMFDRKDIGSIMCIRGGFGATRLLSDINYNLIKSNPKIFIGYSDITVLQHAFFKKTGLVSFHGIVGASAFTDYTINSFNNVFFKNSKEFSIVDNTFLRNPDNSEFEYFVINNGIATGEIIGGNLSMMISLIGTEFNVDYAGKIVFLEDIDEYPYKIDRMLTQLVQATNIRNASAIVFGIFKDCSHLSKNIDEENTLTLKKIFNEKFSNSKIPVVYGFPFGHIENQTIFPIGIRAEINTYENKLTFCENIFTE